MIRKITTRKKNWLNFKNIFFKILENCWGKQDFKDQDPQKEKSESSADSIIRAFANSWHKS